MKNDRILTPSTLAIVFAAHLGLIALMWQMKPPQLASGGDIQFVDLGAFGAAGDLGGSPEPANAAPEPVPEPVTKPVKPKEPPKPKIEDKPKIKPVVVKDKKADMRLPKEKEKPKEPEKKIDPKPVETPKPVQTAEKSAEKPTHTAVGSDGSGAGSSVGNSKSQGQGGGGEGKGRGDKTGDGTGGGGGGGDGSGAGSSAGNPVKRGGQIPRPPYPPLSIENGEEGTVVLKVLVAPGGKVQNVTVTKSSGHRRLDREAEKAARNGRFDAPVWTEFNVPVRFTLQ